MVLVYSTLKKNSLLKETIDDNDKTKAAKKVQTAIVEKRVYSFCTDRWRSFKHA
jgi:hypothetical protein